MNLNIIVSNPNTRIHCLCSELALGKAINSKLHLLYTAFLEFPFSGTRRVPIMFSVHFIIFQITMPECLKSYPNCIWHVLPERFGLHCNSALLTKLSWSYSTQIFRVRVSCKSPINPVFPFTKKSNLQVKLGFIAMASLYELLCHHSLTNNDPLLEDLLSDLPT